MVGVVTDFTHNGQTYEVPSSKDDRYKFTQELKTKLEALDGVEAVYNAGTTASWDGIRLEIELETTTSGQQTCLVPNPRSISPRIRSVFDEFTPVATHKILYTPDPVNAEQGIYDGNLYIAECGFY